MRALLLMALALVACTHAEEVCPDMARKQFAKQASIVGIKIEPNDSMMLLHGDGVVPDGKGVGLRAYLCHNNDLDGWKIVPAGVIQIEPRPAVELRFGQKPAEKEAP